MRQATAATANSKQHMRQATANQRKATAASYSQSKKSYSGNHNKATHAASPCCEANNNSSKQEASGTYKQEKSKFESK
jgi:hypothetical protein